MGKRDHPQRRRSDSWVGRVEWLWQNGIPLVAIVLAVFAVKGATTQVQRQAEGRRVSVGVLCGGLSAVAQAGRAQIAPARDRMSDRFQRNLERLGYPPRTERRVAQLAAADAYVRLIGRGIEQQSGVRGLVRDDGTFDCERLRGISSVRGGG